MSISGIQSNTFNPYVGANPMQQLGQDLQSGNLSAAQSDFKTLQQAFTQPSTTAAGTASGPTFNNTTSPITKAFNQLASDLQSGNLSAAQKDFSTVQQDFKNENHASNNLRYRTSTFVGNLASSGQNGLLQDLSQIGQSLTSSNMAGAQQAYATLQQQLQQFALGGGALTTESPVSFDA
jgi:hypothetical protein